VQQFQEFEAAETRHFAHVPLDYVEMDLLKLILFTLSTAFSVTALPITASWVISASSRAALMLGCNCLPKMYYSIRFSCLFCYLFVFFREGRMGRSQSGQGAERERAKRESKQGLQRR
jgi:uncharacterized membrane protein